MATVLRENVVARIVRLRRQRRFQTLTTFALVILGPMLALATFLALGPLDQGANSPYLRLIVLADLVYILVVAALVLGRVARMVSDRRSQSAGSRLHLRLSGVFALLALIPTILVAVFAMLTFNVGLEGWFSDRVRTVLGSSLAAAQAYDGEHRRDLTEDVNALAAYLNATKQANFFIADDQLRPILTNGQALIQRGLKEAFLIDGAGDLMTRGDRSYLFGFEKPDQAAIDAARESELPVLIEDWGLNELRAIVHLDAYADRYLYVTRKVDGSILGLLDETRETVALYQQLEAERGRILFEFGLLYLGFALILILAAIWLGLWFAERLSRPVGRLAGAAQRVGSGDLDVQVREEDGDDEIAMLGRLFNQMTRQLKGQREALMASNLETEEQRRLFDSVLSSVTAGVIGLDPEGRVDFVNRAAERILDVEEQVHGRDIEALVPEFGNIFKRLLDAIESMVQEEIRLTRQGRMESLLVRIGTRQSDTGQLEGYVIAFDDVTDLVSAQRMAAWGDVARRIAHEIKNPLTPIALSAERIKRKFRKEVSVPEDLEQYSDVIIRQTEDLRRIVNEFSKFARMPEPDRREEDLTRILRDAVTLQQAGQPDVRIEADMSDQPMVMELDATMISQALTNLIKNAGEAIETYVEKGAPEGFSPQIRVQMETQPDQATIRIADNGIGLPPDRARLFEPYVTTREKGTGLGLSIVKKIIEEHGGTLTLQDAEPFEQGAHGGAMAEIRLPRLVRNARGGRGRQTGPGGQGDI